MKTFRLSLIPLLALLVLVSCPGYAQEIVHAVSGVATAVDPATGTITIKTNDGSDGNFRYSKSAKTDLVFDKDVRNGTIDPASFNKVGDHVVAYFYETGFSSRTLVALRDFGPTGLMHVSGTVLKSKRHEIVLKTDNGATQSFDIGKDASAETPGGVVSGSGSTPIQERR